MQHLFTFLLTAIKVLNGQRKSEKLYYEASKSMKTVNFFCFIETNNYTNGMGKIDVADQIRNLYRMIHWL